jgi:hypothetical protein
LLNRDVIAITANAINTGQNSTFVDSSTNNYTVTRAGNVTQGSFTPHSSNEWSGFFDGTGDYLNVPSNDVFAFGSGDFTIECWVNTTPAPGGGVNNDKLLFGSFAFTPSFVFFLHNSNNAPALWNGTVTIIATNGIAGNTWAHVAAVRLSGTVTFYINGIASGSFSYTTNWTSASTVFIGRSNVDTTRNFPGYLSNLRVVKGTALYTADFTPPTQPLTAVAGTSLLTLQDNRFIDRSTNNFAITRFGDTRITVYSPFQPASLYNSTVQRGSAYFDGTGDFLDLPTAAAQLGTGNFTIEFWMYPQSAASLAIFDSRGAATSGDGWFLHYSAAGTFTFSNDGATVITSTIAAPIGAWTHVAICRVGTTITFYTNGVASGTATNSSDFAPNALFYIGIKSLTVSSNVPFLGYISNIRLIAGTAAYTTNFNPPGPVGVVGGTRLLLNFANAAIVDRSGKNNIETLNGAQVSTSITKHGTGSMFFDGVDDFLLIPNNPNLILAGGPWTAECWIYPNGNYSLFRAIFSKRVSGSATTSYQGFLQQTTGFLSFYNGTQFNSSVTPPANQWSHCAWVYTGTNIQIYLNGVSVLNTAVTVTEVNQPLTIGGLQGATEPFAGYIDDFRITKGVARYTGTFTPPAEIYPIILTINPNGDGADGDALQAGDDNFYGGGAGGGSSTTVAGGGGGVGLSGIVVLTTDLLNAATGGTKTTYTDSSVEYIVHTFNSSGTFTSNVDLNVEYLVVAAGGSGGSTPAADHRGGGGGAGGLLTGTTVVSAGTVVVSVGGGGAAQPGTVGANGSPSAFGAITSTGGGAGGMAGVGSNGGSGGGGGAQSTSGNFAGGSPVSGQGFAGGTGGTDNSTYRAGGAGGGAGGVGGNAGTTNGGGIGLQSSINGTLTYYAGGGGQGGGFTGSQVGGLGGGGEGGGYGATGGFPGTANTGGGGGGAGPNSKLGGSGGSGIVIIRYVRAGAGQLVALGGAVDADGQGGSLGANGTDGNGGLYGGGGGGTTNSVVDPTVGNGARGALAIYWFAPEYPNGANSPTVTALDESTNNFQFNINFVPEPVKVLDSYIVDVTAEESSSLTNSIPKYTDFDYNIVQSITSVNVQNKSAESVYVSAGYLTVKTNESDHEMMLVNDDSRQLATGTNLAYQSIQKITPENDPRRITVRLLNYVVGVTGEGPLVPTQVQVWF